jgi:hypothetical protein
MKQLLLILLTAATFSSIGQKVIFPENATGERQRDVRYFQVIGKIQDHFLVYENEKNQNFIQVYDDSMNLERNIKLKFHPEKFLFTKFVNYPDFAWMIYVYRRNNKDYFMAAKINGNGEVVGEPKVLDTTQVKVGATAFINVLCSNDKSKILIYKDHRQIDKVDFTNLVFNSHMELLHKASNETYYDRNKEIFDNFSINNEGDWIFTREKHGDLHTFPRGEIETAQLYIQRHNQDSFETQKLPTKNISLQTLALNIDNLNNKIILNSLYSLSQDIEGLYTAVWNEKEGSWFSSKAIPLGNSIRLIANIKRSPEKALNNFYIHHVILKKDGGFIVLAEQRKSVYSTSTPDIPDKGSEHFLYDTYQKNGRNFLGSEPTNLNSHLSGAEYGNILVLDADNKGDLQWGNVIPKDQFGDAEFSWISFATVYRGDKINFLYNEPYKQVWLLQNQSIMATGKVIANPLMHQTWRKVIFIPSRGRQVSANEFIIPVLHNNNLCFAKIVYENS